MAPQRQEQQTQQPSSKIYESALADVRKIREVATASATTSLVEQLTPRIREFVDAALYENVNNDALDADTGTPFMAPATSDEVVQRGPNVIHTDDDGEGSLLELDENEACMVKECTTGPSTSKTKRVDEIGVYRFINEISAISTVNALTLEAIGTAISRAADIYEQVSSGRGSIVRQEDLQGALLQLESCNKKLHTIKDLKERQMKNKNLNEADVSIKLQGLPDSLLDDPEFLDKLNVELSQEDEDDDAAGDQGADAPEGDGDGDEGAPPPAGDEGGDGDDDGGGLDFGSLNLDGGGDAGGGDDNGEEPVKEEGAGGMTDDTVIEIDEGMLRSEIARLKRLNEGKPAKIPAATQPGNPIPPKTLSDFGGGKSAKDAFLDSEGMTGSDDRTSMRSQRAGLSESDEIPGIDESDAPVDLEKQHETVSEQIAETVKRYNSAKERGLKATCRMLKETYDGLKKKQSSIAGRINEARRSGQVASRPAANARPGSNTQAGATKLSEAVALVGDLRKQLKASNTLNAKLGFAIRLLQNEGLTGRQKAQVIDSMDKARTPAEAKLVYESFTKALDDDGAGSGSLNESARGNRGGSSNVAGGGSTSASRGSGSSQSQSMNEGFEAERWALLAGISKSSR